MVSEVTTTDPASTYQAAPDADEASDSISESSSTDSSSDEQGSHDEELSGPYDPISAPEVWNPNFKMYKHIRTQVVHLLADGTTHAILSAVESDCQQIINRLTPVDFWNFANARGVRLPNP